MITFKGTKPLKDYDSVSLAEILRAHFTEYFPLREVQRLNDAIQVASYLHRHDVRRGNRGKLPNPPYIEHPLRVAIRLARTFAVKDPHVITAAVLHDTIEDHPFDFADFQGVRAVEDEREARIEAMDFLGEHFGYLTAALVSQVSNPIIPPGIAKTEKIAQYQDHVAKVVSYSGNALIVKVSDFVDNAGSLHHHYEYNDPKVGYFLDRYEPLLEIYRGALKTGAHGFNSLAALARLDDVEAQFDLFRSA